MPKKRKVKAWTGPALPPPPEPKRERLAETAADRRNNANRLAGWPVKESINGHN